jgi:putative ABC transport system permease protein
MPEADRPSDLARAERKYRVLLRLLPAHVRAEAETDLLAVFRDDVRRLGGGPVIRLRFWLRIVADTLVTALAERRPKAVTSGVVRDARFAIRTWRRQPGFAFAAMLALAFGIGVNTAVFSAIDATLFRPMPLREPDRLVFVWETAPKLGAPKYRVSPADAADWRTQNHVFTGMAAMRSTLGVLLGNGAPEEVAGRGVSGNFFALLGVPPLLGRTLNEADDVAAASPVVVSYGLWQRRLGGDESVIGRRVELDGVPCEVIGVMPRTFAFPDRDTEFWRPLSLAPALAARRNSHFLTVVARLAPRVSAAQAQQEMTVIAARLETSYPSTNAGSSAVVVPLQQELLGEARGSLIALGGATACVLLIACANVANLLLVRAAARRRELAVRRALGASRRRLVGQMLTESLLLACVSGAVGLLLATWAAKALVIMVPATFPGVIDVGLNLRALVFTAAVSLSTGVVFGLVPALQSSRAGLAPEIKEGGRTGTGRGGWMRDAFVVSEVALALVLLIGAGLLVETLVRLQHVDAGFQADAVLTAETYVRFPKYDDHVKRNQFYLDVIARLQAIPGVTSVGLTSDLPLTSRGNTMGFVADSQVAPPPQGYDALFRLVSADYFHTMGIEMRAGRPFAASDDARAAPVAIVNETLASSTWPGARAIGNRIQVANVDYTVIGIARDVRERGLDRGLKNEIYLPFEQFEPSFFVPSEIAVRTDRSDPQSLAHAVETAVWQVDPDQPVTHVRTMSAIVDGELEGRARVLQLLTVLAALAIGLAAVGVHSVLAYAVVESKRAIGIRLALGASPQSVIGHVLSHGLRLAAAGLLIGTVAAIAATRVLGSLLFGVSATEPGVFAAVGAMVLGVSVMACVLPARRAAGIDPIIVLREGEWTW